VTSKLRPLALHFKTSLSSFIWIPYHPSTTKTLHHILLHKEYNMVSDMQYDTLKQTMYVLLSFIFLHFYHSSTAHTNYMTEKRSDLIMFIAIQCTCFPLTSTAVMKGLMLSTVWWSRLLQYLTATQYRKQPAWWYKFFRWSSTATITHGSQQYEKQDDLHWHA